MAPLHPTVEISQHKSRVAEAEAGFSAADWVSRQELHSRRMTDILYTALFRARAHNLFSIDYTSTRLFKRRSENSEFILPAFRALTVGLKEHLVHLLSAKWKKRKKKVNVSWKSSAAKLGFYIRKYGEVIAGKRLWLHLG